ncbi:hypothetical protein MVEN_00409300 [Mycena venus]|uniref:Uncharacterized protein n=1 Tax=Mycena venus TaxID=2733690 RepID=A0A8H6YQH1_9AGAR|nr:hypothetical protein MVEN_00409300 [Mycena venus]
MEDHDELPRISVPSMRVWLRIKAEYAKQAQDRIDEYVKHRKLPSHRRDELLRESQQYVDKVFAISQSNIRINGRDFDSLQPHEQDAEPFDEALDRKIWALAGSRLEWHRRIALERREKPPALENTLQELVKEHESLDVDLDAEEPSLPDMEDDESLQFDVDDSVKSHIFAITNELTQNLPNQRERSEQSRAVEAEYKALKP